jgi:DNA-binding PadR family transcriptional regulator
MTSPAPPDHRPLRPLDFSVLLVLAEQEDYGYQIVKRIAKADAGGVRLAPSNLYNVLDRMMDAGLVQDLGQRTQEARPARRYYGITELGRAVVSAEAQRLEAVVRSAGRLDLLAERRGT